MPGGHPGKVAAGFTGKRFYAEQGLGDVSKKQAKGAKVVQGQHPVHPQPPEASQVGHKDRLKGTFRACGGQVVSFEVRDEKGDNNWLQTVREIKMTWNQRAPPMPTEQAGSQQASQGSRHLGSLVLACSVWSSSP